MRTAIGFAMPNRKYLAAVAVLVAAAANMFTIWWIADNNSFGYTDLQIYRLGAKSLLIGDDLYRLPDPASGLRFAFGYPPFATLVFGPLVALPLSAAIVVMTALSCVAVGATAWILVRTSAAPTVRGTWFVAATLLLAVLITLTEPGRKTLSFGQVNLLLMAMITADFLLPRTGLPGGVLTGLAAGIKLTPLAFVVLFLALRDWRAAVRTVGAFAFTVGLGWAITPSGSSRYWFHLLLPSARGTDPAFPGNLSLRSLFAKLSLSGGGLTVAWGVAVVVTGALLAATVHHLLRVGERALALAATSDWALLISPISWSHHWVWAAPGLALLLVLAWRRRQWPVVAIVSVAVLVFTFPQVRMLGDAYPDARSWTWWQQLVGNAYPLLGLTFLVLGAIGWWADRERPRQRN